VADPHRHPVFARCYAWMSQRTSAAVAQHRATLLAGLAGRVVEVGAGNGMNFAHYPATVAAVLAVEPEQHLRRLAGEAATEAPVPVEVVDGVADRLPAAGASFDAAVLSLVLCSVPDMAVALAEVRRVLRPGGELRFFEHVLADSPRLARVQRGLDATVWPRLAGGCHTARDAAAAIERGGFVVTQLNRFRVPESGIQSPLSPLILGSATRS
jgi:ubiquinone/menaquinone biosynthesis C-methylase UbiE